MRQGQQNRRGRGRNNGGHNNHSNGNGNSNNRRGQNPLARSFESNGPEVKLRGNAAHIAEKYMSLARDAQSSGDPVLAENYLQHAEHYNRIIMAYRDQQVSQGGDPGQGPQGAGDGGGEMDGDDQGDEFSGDMQPSFAARGGEPQPRSFDQPQPRFDDRPQRPQNDQPRNQNAYQGRDRQGYQDRGDRQDRGERRDRFERNDRQERPDRQDRPERFNRPERPERIDRPAPAGDVRGENRPDNRPESRPETRPEPRDDGPPMRRRERPAQDRGPGPAEVHEQPEFLRRPVRRPRRDEGEAAVDTVSTSGTSGDEPGGSRE